MKLDDDLQQQFERSQTAGELSIAVRETLARHGRDSSDKWVRFIIKSYCGGIRVDVDAFGQLINRLRRKFLMKLNLGSNDERRKDDKQTKIL